MKKAICLFSILALFVCAAAWPHSGLTFNKRSRGKATAKITGGFGESHSVLWVRNLSPRTATVELHNTSSVDESPYVSDPIVGGATMGFAEQLPVTLRQSGDLIVQSDEQVAAILANQDLPIDRSEFFLPGQQEVGKSDGAPRWVTNLEIVGKSGSNLLKAGSSGYAPVVKGRGELNKRYEFSVTVALRKRNSSVQVRLINSNDEVIKSAILSGSAALYWRSELGEYISGNPDFPVRFEMSVLSGKAQGFFSTRDLESGENTPIAIVPKASKVNGIQPAGGGAYGGGIAFFSNGVLDCNGSSYTYHVVNAPPNTCGTLYIKRNGVQETGPGWICTDNNGNATKGSWSVSTNQTGEDIYILWPDGTRTSGGDDKTDDYSAPYVPDIDFLSYQNGVPTSFSGTATDVMWGSGFGAATNVLVQFAHLNTGKYWDGSSYSSSSPVYFGGSFSVTGQWTASWWFNNVPPVSAHQVGNDYNWCVSIDDKCNQRSGTICLNFTRN